MRRFPKRAAAVAVVAALAGCESTSEPSLTAGLNLRLSGPLVDTITAGPAPLVITLLDSAGNRLSNITLTIAVQDSIGYTSFFLAAPGGAAPPVPPVFPFVTDASGELALGLYRTGYARKSWLWVSSASGGVNYRDSLLIETLAGAPAGFVMPVDTALYQGNSTQWRVQTVDRSGNPRSEQATLEAGTPGITVNGRTVTATAGPSRQRVRARLGAVRDSVWLSIVPRGVIAMVVDSPYPIPRTLARMELDGSAYTELFPQNASPFVGAIPSQPQWFPSGGDLMVGLSGGIWRLAAAGTFTRMFPTPTGLIYNWPQMTLDGARLFFHRIDQRGLPNNDAIAYTATIAGSGADTARISPPFTFAVQDVFPSPSPDDRYVAVASDRLSADYYVHVIDRQTGTMQNLGVRGTGPRWSPDGQWITFAWDHTLKIIHPDGTGFHELAPLGAGYEAWVAWSPDSKWIAVERYGPQIELIEAATNLHLPLGFTGWMRTPAWRPY